MSCKEVQIFILRGMLHCGRKTIPGQRLPDTGQPWPQGLRTSPTPIPGSQFKSPARLESIAQLSLGNRAEVGREMGLTAGLSRASLCPAFARRLGDNILILCGSLRYPGWPSHCARAHTHTRTWAPILRRDLIRNQIARRRHPFMANIHPILQLRKLRPWWVNLLKVSKIKGG